MGQIGKDIYKEYLSEMTDDDLIETVVELMIDALIDSSEKYLGGREVILGKICGIAIELEEIYYKGQKSNNVIPFKRQEKGK